MSAYSGVDLLLAGAAGPIVTLTLIRLMVAFAPRIGLVDLPDARKIHNGPVPLVGGIALVLAYLASASLMLPQSQTFAGCLVGLGLLLAVGVLDDMQELSPRIRLVAQVVAAVSLVWISGLQITSLGNLFGTGEVVLSPLAGFVFTVFCVVSLINGVNMLDGLDGLAGGVSAAILTAFMLVSIIAEEMSSASHLALLVACVAAFLLFHNFRSPLRQKLVFLGDAGSMTLGFMLAAVAVNAGTSAVGLYPIAAVWVLGLVVLDTVTTVLRRLAQKRNPLSAGRDHLHHLLLELGLPVPAVVILLLAIASVLATVGIVGWMLRVPESMLAASFVVLSFAYLVVVNLGWRKVRVRRRPVAEVMMLPVRYRGVEFDESPDMRRTG